MNNHADSVGIMNLLASYAHLCDDDRFDDFESLFLDDALLVVAGESVAGAKAIRNFVEHHQNAGIRGKHLIGNAHITVDGESAAVTSDFFFLKSGVNGLRLWRSGRYLDVLRRVGDEWRFARHEVTFAPRFAGDASSEAAK